jgi:transposase
MKHVNQELNKLRKRMNVTGGKIKYLLLKNKEDLSKEEIENLEIVLDNNPCLAIAHELKEELRRIYEKTRKVAAGKRKIEKWLRVAALLYQDSARMIEDHLDGICNYFLHRTTNGVAEGINTKVQLIKRQGYGFTNFENFKMNYPAASGRGIRIKISSTVNLDVVEDIVSLVP